MSLTLAIPSSAPGQLVFRYLFGVQFGDGSEYFQTEEDKSVDPELASQGRSAFTDVIRGAAERGGVKLFQLEGQGHKYVVSLEDGHFEIDGVPFYVNVPLPNVTLELLYFRRRRHFAEALGTVQEDGRTVSLSDLNETRQECEYHFGWKAGEVIAELIVL